MKTYTFITIFGAITLAATLFLTGCEKQGGLAIGHVKCCITQSDGSKACQDLPQGDCKGITGASIVDDCKSCK